MSSRRSRPGGSQTIGTRLRRIGPIALAIAGMLVGSQAANASAASRGPIEQAELSPSDPITYGFGWSVAISGSTAVVGAPHCFHTGCPGAAYVFVRSGPSWVEQAELTASDGVGGDDFGQNVAISRDTVIVGVPGKHEGRGVVYVFVRSGDVWTQQAELTASDGVARDSFGISVAISGTTILAGATRGSGGPGAAYVFTGAGPTWTQEKEIVDPDGLSSDAFGISVALSGSTVVVGADYADELKGAAFVYTHSRGIWKLRAELTASDGEVGKEFGHAVAISGSTVVVGAPVGVNYDPGRGYVFERRGNAWSQTAELTAPGAPQWDEFGYSVAVVGTTALIGAYYTGPAHAGAAYVFVNDGGIWSETAKLAASDAQSYDNFGYSVALYRTNAVIGAPNHELIGSAYVFTSV